jgi:hypothetical protein
LRSNPEFSEALAAAATKSYYSLTPVCPDASRLESINLGVLVYSPETGWLQFLLAQGNDRIRKGTQAAL